MYSRSLYDMIYPFVSIFLNMRSFKWWCSQTNPKLPDFKHRRTREALWIDGLANPPWVKSKLIAMGQRAQSPVGSDVQVPFGVVTPDRKWYCSLDDYLVKST